MGIAAAPLLVPMGFTAARSVGDRPHVVVPPPIAATAAANGILVVTQDDDFGPLAGVAGLDVIRL